MNDSTANNGTNGKEVQQNAAAQNGSNSNDKDLLLIEHLATAKTSSTSREHAHAPPESAEATDQASVSDQHDDTQLQKQNHDLIL